MVSFLSFFLPLYLTLRPFAEHQPFFLPNTPQRTTRSFVKTSSRQNKKTTKPSVLALIDEFGKLYQPLSSAVAEELDLALQNNNNNNSETLTDNTGSTTERPNQNDDVIEDIRTRTRCSAASAWVSMVSTRFSSASLVVPPQRFSSS